MNLPMPCSLNFYHLTTEPLERALPRLLEKAMGSKRHILVQTDSPERTDALDQLLWTFEPGSFLPHGTAKDGPGDRQPVFLTHQDGNPNGAQILVLVDRAESPLMDQVERCLVLFDGNDPAAVARARSAWKAGKDRGCHLVYFQQQPGGGWAKQQEVAATGN